RGRPGRVAAGGVRLCGVGVDPAPDLRRARHPVRGTGSVVDQRERRTAHLGARGGSGEGDLRAAEELAELCEGLPAALRAVAIRLATRPHWTLGQMVLRLRDQRWEAVEFNV